MFISYPTYPRYRSIKVGVSGEDVYALQTALKARSFDPGPLDGICGNGTGAAIRQAQLYYGLLVDGYAGGQTQRALALAVAGSAGANYGIAPGALKGQLEHESGYRVGNYSALRSDGSYDAGVAQRNTAHTPVKDGFTVPSSILALARVIRSHFDLFDGLTLRRRWALAQGAWNAPAFACYIAREEGALQVPVNLTLRPGATARQTFETYIDSVTVYLSV